MSPQFNLARGFKWRVLIIDMVQSVQLAQAVGVIQPARFRHQMES